MEDSPKAIQILGIDLGGTKTALVAGDSRGRIFQRVEFPTYPQVGYDGWLKRLPDALAELKTLAGAWRPEVSGISAGGPADWKCGRLLSPPNLPGWDCSVRDDVSRLTGLPCRMEHDGRAGALAEHRFGAGQGCANVIFLTFGTGMGAGIIIDGRIYRGTCGAAGEIGHVRLAEDGPEAYGKTGSVEAFASGAGISRLAARMYPARWPEEPGAQAVIEAARTGDPDAGGVLRASAQKLGMTLALLVDVLNPEVIILGSLATRLPEAYLKQAFETLEAEALPGNFACCRVVRSGLGARLQDTAALMAALEGL